MFKFITQKPPKKSPPKAKRGGYRGRGRRGRRPNVVKSRKSVSGASSSTLGTFLGFMRVARILISSLPIENVTLTSIFDFLFNLIAKSISRVNYYTGVYSIFEITPGSMLANSPLLAKDGTNYSFPGYPVNIRYLRLKLKNTTSLSEHSGRWTAVFIPYREQHDPSHIKDNLKKMTYHEVSAMPHSVTNEASKDISLYFKMRNNSDYCSRPRELGEPFGVVLIIWDTSLSKDLITSPISNSTFNCEIAMEGGISPNVIFGPTHRTNYDSSVFTVKQITDGATVRVEGSGPPQFEEFSSFEARRRLSSMELP